MQFESTVGDAQTSQIFQFFRNLGYSGVLLLGDRYLSPLVGEGGADAVRDE